MGEQGFEYIISLLTTLDPVVQILIIIFIGPLFYILYKLIKNKDFRDDVFRLFKRKQKDTIYNIGKHEIFLSKSIYNNYIQNITFNSKLKDDIFKIILNTKVKVVLNKVKEFIKLDFKDIENIDIIMFDVVDDIVDTYEKQIKLDLLIIYKEDSDYLYEKVYENNFKSFHSHNITYILKAIKLFSKSRLTKNQKVYMFLNLIYIALDLAVLDCERTFDTLNGSLNEYNEKWHK